jgi:hypothetical protein
MKVRFVVPGAILGLFLLLMLSCQDEEQTGRIEVKITDDPFPISLIEEASVTITKVEIRAANSEEENNGESSESEADGDESNFIVLFEDSHKAVLTDLRNGVTDALTNLEIPADEYDLIRIQVKDASITLNENINIPVNVPSGEQSGVKVFIKPGIILGGGEAVEVLLDFSLEKSFVPVGEWSNPEDIERFNFKPVIRAVNNSEAGMIKGYIFSAEEPLGGVLVYVEEDGQKLATITEEDGSYAILGIQVGAYQITAEKEGYNSMTCAEVEVLAGKATGKDFVLGKLPEFPE